jgi:hypothetical protein
MAEDAKSADGIAEASDDAGRLLVDEQGGPATYWRCRGNGGERKNFSLAGVII